MTEKVKVSGIAVKSGISKNKHKFLAEELTLAAENSQGKTYPLIKDHDHRTDSTIGRVTFNLSQMNSKGETIIPFAGFAKDYNKDGTIQKIKDGVLTEVSIGAHAKRMVKETEDSTELIPKGITFGELTVTPTPAVEDTSIATETIQNKNNENLGGKKMEKKDIEVLKEENQKLEKELLELKNEKLKASIKEQNKEPEKKPEDKTKEKKKPEEKEEKKKIEKKTEEKDKIMAIKEDKTKIKENTITQKKGVTQISANYEQVKEKQIQMANNCHKQI